MIERIQVQAFKSLEDVTVDLGHVNLFIGANGAGKSNLLEAIGVLGAAAKGRVDDEALVRRGVRPGLASLYRTSFRGSRLHSQIRFGATARDASYGVGLYQRADPGSTAWQYHTESLHELGVKLVGRSPNSRESLNWDAGLTALRSVEWRPDRPASQLLKDLSDYCIFSPTTPQLRGLIPDTSSSMPVGLSGGRLPEATADLFRGTLDERMEEIHQQLLSLIGWADEFRAVPPEQASLARSVPAAQTVLRFRDRFMAEGRNTLSAHDASEGALYLLFAAVLALHPAAPRVLAIDNVDHALNPRLARALMQHLCAWALDGSKDCQLLLTSHNPLILDGLPLQDDRVRLFTVNRTTTGRTSVKRVVVDANLVAHAKKGLTLSRLWVMGLLGGGVPDDV